jgi:hypothetical protein
MALYFLGYALLLAAMMPLVFFLLGFVPEKAYKEALTVVVSTLVSLAAAAVVFRFIDKRRFSSLGLTLGSRSLVELGWGLLVGFLMLTAAVGGMWAMGYEDIRMGDGSDHRLEGLLMNLILFVGVGFHEEVLFRGYLFQSLTEGIGKLPAVVLFSGLFGVVHMGNPNVSPFGIANIVLAGVLLSLAYLRTRSLWLPIGIHIAWNFTQGYIWGLPVSGTTVARPLSISQETGPDWITGGTFGPEGGAMCTLVCLAACWIVWRFFRPSETMNRIVEEALKSEPFKPAEVAPVLGSPQGDQTTL